MKIFFALSFRQEQQPVDTHRENPCDEKAGGVYVGENLFLPVNAEIMRRAARRLFK